MDGDISSVEVSNAVADVELIQHVHVDKENLTKIVKEVTVRWPFKKEHLEMICGVLTTVVWNWIDGYPDQFSALQHTPEDELTGQSGIPTFL